MEAPIAQFRAVDEQRPARAIMQFYPMCRSRKTKFPLPGLANNSVMYATRRNCPFLVSAFEKNGDIPGRMVVQSAIVVGMQELVQVDIEKIVARDDPPTTQVGIILVANHEIRRPRSGYFFKPAHVTAHFLTSAIMIASPIRQPMTTSKRSLVVAMSLGIFSSYLL
jgi:hypothetical protein